MNSFSGSFSISCALSLGRLCGGEWDVVIPSLNGTKHRAAVALTTITDYGGERSELIPSWDEIDAWWKAGLLDPI